MFLHFIYTCLYFYLGTFICISTVIFPWLRMFFLALAKKPISHFFFKWSISCRLQVASCVYIYDYCKKEHFYQVTPSCFLPNPVAASIDKARDEIVSGILGQFKGNELEIVGKRKRWHNCHKRMCKNCNTHCKRWNLPIHIYTIHICAILSML